MTLRSRRRSPQGSSLGCHALFRVAHHMAHSADRQGSGAELSQRTTALAESLEVLVWLQFEKADIDSLVGLSVDDADLAGFGRDGKASLVGNDDLPSDAVGRGRHEQLVG